MWEPDSFISELFTIDAHTSSTILVRDITALSHETLDDSMEEVSFVAVATVIVASADRSEVLTGFWDQLSENLKHHSLNISRGTWCWITNLHIKEALSISWIESW